MKDEKNLGGSRKNPSFRGKFTENHYIGGDSVKRECLVNFQIKGGGKKVLGGVFEGGRGDTAVYTIYR